MESTNEQVGPGSYSQDVHISYSPETPYFCVTPCALLPCHAMSTPDLPQLFPPNSPCSPAPLPHPLLTRSWSRRLTVPPVKGARLLRQDLRHSLQQYCASLSSMATEPAATAVLKASVEAKTYPVRCIGFAKPASVNTRGGVCLDLFPVDACFTPAVAAPYTSERNQREVA